VIRVCSPSSERQLFRPLRFAVVRRGSVVSFFQAGHAGSIPVTRSTLNGLVRLHGADLHHRLDRASNRPPCPLRALTGHSPARGSRHQFKTRRTRPDSCVVAQTLNYRYVSEVATKIHIHLKPLGFAKRRHAWNCSIGDGVVQCISLGMDEYVPPHDHRPADALYRSRSANYELGAAVFFEEVAELWGRPPKTFVTEAQCAVRWHDDRDVTSRWPIAGIPQDAAVDVYATIAEAVIPWLAESSDRSQLVAGGAENVPTPAFAAIAVRAGRPDLASARFRTDMADPESHPRYVANIPKLAAQLGIYL
jgi:hypothetical protein